MGRKRERVLCFYIYIYSTYHLYSSPSPPVVSKFKTLLLENGIPGGEMWGDGGFHGFTEVSSGTISH